ncbi:Uu.00g104450.m01.CDS01 [Anthostomella pinea]|uniref:Uu.00g104450.m01.CDS01 n=1 Tax=Anthostomella pinea TaxID=933095 RepID=A0AAI8VDL4_9PEZI|nr:Uu.00g104450.m01.CDS01 [Anthostomella pinea]
MASAQYGSLTPLQHYNQQQHYGVAFQVMPQQAQPPPPPPQQHLPSTALPTTMPDINHMPALTHTHLQPNGTPLQTHAHLQPQPQSTTPIPTPILNTVPSPNLPATPSTTGGRGPKRRRTTNNNDSTASQQTPSPAPPTTVHPFSKGPYETLEDAIFALQLHVFTSGYGVSQKRTVKEKLPSGKYDPEGDIIRKDFSCDKGGNEFVSQSRGERRRESKKCGCQWKAAIRRLRRENNHWFVEILEPAHNHPVTPADEMHTLASYRRWQRENNAGIRSAIARLTRAAALPARQVVAYLRGDVADPDLDRIDKQILRALSMNDKELPGTEGKDGSSVAFDMLARRPVIILQDNGGTATPSNNNASTIASTSGHRELPPGGGVIM